MSDAPGPTPGGPFPVTAALVVVTGIGPLATDSYIAALPAMQRSLHTSATIIQLTLTAFIIGIAAGQLILGPISDGIGRRRLLLCGTTAFGIMSVICAVATTGPLLVSARLVQGMAAGCGVAIGRAVVADAYRGDEAAKRLGSLAAINFLGPVLAPALGGLVLGVGSWRTVFAILAGLGVVMTLAVIFGIPETLPPEQRHGDGLAASVQRMGDLLTDRVFVRHIVLICLTYAGFFTYIGGGAFVLETVYGVSQPVYAAIFATNAAAMAVTSLTFRFTVTRVGAAWLRSVGIAVETVAACGLVVVAVLLHRTAVPLAVPWVLLSCVTAGQGLVTPATMTLALEAGRRFRGTASALQGGCAFLVGAAVTPLTGILGYSSLTPMAALMAGFLLLASLVLFRGRGRPLA